MSTLNEQATEMRVALFANSQLWASVTRLSLLWLKSDEAGDLAGLRKSAWVFDRENVFHRRDGTHAMDLHQSFSLGVFCLDHPEDQLVKGGDLIRQGLNRSENWAETRFENVWN
jgi:hypothetical protein